MYSFLANLRAIAISNFFFGVCPSVRRGVLSLLRNSMKVGTIVLPGGPFMNVDLFCRSDPKWPPGGKFCSAEKHVWSLIAQEPFDTTG